MPHHCVSPAASLRHDNLVGLLWRILWCRSPRHQRTPCTDQSLPTSEPQNRSSVGRKSRKAPGVTTAPIAIATQHCNHNNHTNQLKDPHSVGEPPMDGHTLRRRIMGANTASTAPKSSNANHRDHLDCVGHRRCPSLYAGVHAVTANSVVTKQAGATSADTTQDTPA